MELRHLRYFVAVAEELNYRKASERLRVAQPALSSQIQDLEADLGVRLLDRNTGGVRLTDAGTAFLAETRLTLAQAEKAKQVAQETAKGMRGHLTVAYIAPLLMGFMPESLKTYHEKFPEVDVNLVEMPLTEQMAALQDGTLQIGFMVGRDTPVPAGLKQMKIARSAIRAVVGTSHPLASQAKISLVDLAREPLLAFSIRRGVTVHADFIRRNFDLRGLKIGPIRSIEGAETFRASLEGGLGVSLIPDIGSLARSAELTFKPLKETGVDLTLELFALWRPDRSSVLASNFLATLKKLRPRSGEPAIPASAPSG